MTGDLTPADIRREHFTVLARELMEPLRRYLVRRTDAHTADDVLAEVLLVLWRRFEEVPAADVRPWCFGVARHALANAHRSARRQDRLVAKVIALDPPSPQAPADPARLAIDGSADDPDLSAALSTLGEVDAEIVRLWAWEELPPRDIAIVLGLTANAVSIRLHRAKARIATELRKNATVRGHVGVEGSRP